MPTARLPIIFLQSIKLIACKKRYGLVDCAVGQSSLNTIQVIYDRSMTQEVSRRSLTAEARVLSQASPCEICDEQSVTGTGFSPSTSVFSREYNFTSTPYSPSPTSCSYQKDKWGKPEKLPRSVALS